MISLFFRLWLKQKYSLKNHVEVFGEYWKDSPTSRYLRILAWEAHSSVFPCISPFHVLNWPHLSSHQEKRKSFCSYTLSRPPSLGGSSPEAHSGVRKGRGVMCESDRSWEVKAGQVKMLPGPVCQTQKSEVAICCSAAQARRESSLTTPTPPVKEQMDFWLEETSELYFICFL